MDFTWTQILVAAVGSIGGVSGVVTLLVFITGRIDKRREREKAAQDKAIHETEGIRRLEYEFAQKTDEAVKAELWRLIGEQKEEIRLLKAEIEESEAHQSLSRPAIQKIYNASRKIRRQVDNLSFLVMKETAHDDLAKEVEILRQDVEELEKSLP